MWQCGVVLISGSQSAIGAPSAGAASGWLDSSGGCLAARDGQAATRMASETSAMNVATNAGWTAGRGDEAVAAC